MATLTIRDETATGRTTGELTLDVLDETITVRELIRSREYQEVQDHNRRRANAEPVAFNGLVTPRDEERMLNAGAADAKPRHLREIDWRRQFDVACDAFQRNGSALPAAWTARGFAPTLCTFSVNTCGAGA